MIPADLRTCELPGKGTEDFPVDKILCALRGGTRGDPDGGATFPDRGAQFYMPR